MILFDNLKSGINNKRKQLKRQSVTINAVGSYKIILSVSLGIGKGVSSRAGWYGPGVRSLYF